jgi:glycosyltransferase involved in cell wall biosynthesis
VSTAMREEAARIGLQPKQLFVLPMGVDLKERFTPDPQVERSRDKLLFVGRLVPKKGLCHLLDALPLVLQQYPTACLSIAGFGPKEALLRAQARRLGIGDHVRFLGAVSQAELPALYRKAAVFAAPFVRDPTGDQEGLPVVVMEAIGCGCPVVVGNVAGIADLLGEATSHFHTEPADSAALASAVAAPLANPGAAQQRALELRATLADRLDWDVIAAQYGGILETAAS